MIEIPNVHLFISGLWVPLGTSIFLIVHNDNKGVP